MKHLLKLLDLTGEEIIDILNQADQLKYENKHGIEHPYLKGKAHELKAVQEAVGVL